MFKTISVLKTIALTLLVGCVTDQSQLESRRDDIAMVEQMGDADKLFIVDCLLPGQIRRLGTMTYVSSRTPIKTTAGQCEIQGGEYVAFDRANFATALQIWLPQAQAGDAEAQVYLGEIYEKGLGVKADYKTAAEWYRKAAAQGNSRAQTNLGYLYENGLGVDKDKAVAMEWYRKSSGLEAKDVPYATSINTAANNELVEQIKLLKSELKQSQSESQALSKQLSENQRLLKESQEKLQRYQKERDNTQSKLNNAQSQGNSLERARLEKMLRDKESELAAQQQQVAAMESQYQQKVANLSQKLEASDKRAKQIENQLQTQQSADAAAKPVIEIIDPPFVLARGTPTVTLRSAVKERDIIGKVTSSSGIISLTVNDIKKTPDEKGLFKTTVGISGAKTPVSIVAVDRNGKSETLNFLFTLSESASTQPAPIGENVTVNVNIWKSIDFGNYYALVIGNQHYKKIPPLDTPANDARAVERVLREKYGFKTTLLLDANRYQMLSAMNRLRSELTENDNLLIYYAGHGELDQINMRGQWLPVDAEADNNANWISNVSITDILNTMSSKHILLVVDSCYSGSLTRSSLARLDAGMSDEKKAELLKAMLKLKSRTVLTAGGLEPVIDGGGGSNHSVFANALIKALRSNDGLLEGQQLYKKVSDLISVAQVDQVPEYAPIAHAGHEGAGEFFFMPK